MPRWLRRATTGVCPLAEASRFSVGIFLELGLRCLLARAPPDRDSCRFGLSANPGTVDPRYATDAASARIIRLISRSPVYFNTRLKRVPALASWEQLTPRQHRFILGVRGRRFDDGRRLTASNVKATDEFILDADTASPHRSALSVFEQVEIDDEDVLDFLLSRSDLLFPRRLVTGVLPAHLMASGHPFDTQPVGSDFTYIGYNLKDPVVGQLPVRRAVVYAIDRQAIIRYIMGGAARLVNALLMPDRWAGNPALVGNDDDPARCRRLLLAAG